MKKETQKDLTKKNCGKKELKKDRNEERKVEKFE